MTYRLRPTRAHTTRYTVTGNPLDAGRCSVYNLVSMRRVSCHDTRTEAQAKADRLNAMEIE